MELLLVILIIAVLVSIAAPQYKVAVLRVKYLKLQQAVRRVMTAEQLYKTAHGNFTVDLDVLDVEFPTWKSQEKETQADETGTTRALYQGFQGESLIILDRPNYLEITMHSDELPVAFQMFDWHYPDMAINPDVMQEHLIESYCHGSVNNMVQTRRLCEIFGADVGGLSQYASWKF